MRREIIDEPISLEFLSKEFVDFLPRIKRTISTSVGLKDITYERLTYEIKQYDMDPYVKSLEDEFKSGLIDLILSLPYKDKEDLMLHINDYIYNLIIKVFVNLEDVIDFEELYISNVVDNIEMFIKNNYRDIFNILEFVNEIIVIDKRDINELSAYNSKIIIEFR